MNRRLSHLTVLLVLAAIYFCAGKLGLSLAFIHVSASAVWPPTGIALVAILLWGRWVAPAIFLGAFLVNLTTKGNLGTSAGIALGNTLEAVVGAWLVNRYARGRYSFDEPRAIFRFVLFAAILSTLISATVGVTSLCLGGFASWSGFPAVWFTWWIGDLVSDIIVAPLLLIWSSHLPARLNRPQIPEALALAATVFLVGEALFSDWVAPQGKIFAIEYLALPPLLWGAWRFGPRGASAAALGMAVIAIRGTLHEFGPFAMPDQNESFLLLQTFLASITLTALVLAAVVAERKHAETALRDAQLQLRTHATELEKHVAERTYALREMVESLEGFCYSIAHDLRAPLRSINRYIGLLSQHAGTALDDTARDYAQRISDVSETMDKLILDLLEFGRLSAADLRLEPVDVNKVVRDAVDQLLHESSGHGVHVRLAGPFPPVLANRAVTEQVIMNLLRNAAKFVAPGVPAQITLGADVFPDRVRVWVQDNGIGIDPAFHATIFGVFERLHPERSYPGTGIGLAIVKKGVERMGGRVGLESTPGQGSRFWFELKPVPKPPP